MIKITRELFQKLFDEYKGLMMLSRILAVGCPLLGFLFIYILDSTLSRMLVFCLCLTPIIAISFIRKRLIPPGYNNDVQSVMQTMKYDFLSDNIMNMIIYKMGQCKDYPSKCHLTFLLADVYELRGQMTEAINTIYSVDRSRFKEYPSIGMSFFNSLLDIYMQFDDKENAKAAFADAQNFIAECYDRSYVLCETASSIMINAYMAEDRYYEALELMKIKDEMKMKFKQTSAHKGFSEGTPLDKLDRGLTYIKLAELYYHCGDPVTASKYADMGGPLLTVSPHELERANRISAMIREAQTVRE